MKLLINTLALFASGAYANIPDHPWIPGGPTDCAELPHKSYKWRTRSLILCSSRAMPHDEHFSQPWLPPS